MLHKVKFIVTLFFAFLFAAFPILADAAVETNISNLADTIINGAMGGTDIATVSESISLLRESGSSAADWYTIALNQRSEQRFDTAAHDADGGNAVSRQRTALAMISAGVSPDAPELSSIAESTYDKGGIMSLIFALHLINNNCGDEALGKNIIGKLLDLRLEDGGWAVTGKFSDVDVTAMAIQALAPHRGAPAVSAAIESAVELLIEKQLGNGGFASFGAESAESAAQVIIALASIDIDCREDARFTATGGNVFDALMRFMLKDGTFSHVQGGESNANATAQAFCAVVALEKFENGSGALFFLAKKDTAEPDDVSGIASTTETSGLASGVASVAPDYNGTNIKWIIIGLILLAFVATLLSMAAKKRLTLKNILLISALTLTLCGITALLNIRTPEEYYSNESIAADGSATLTIRCDTIAGRDGVPSDGCVLGSVSVEFAEGESVYDILVRAARENSLHLEHSGPDGMEYIVAIGNLYEQQYGALSGWVYYVNGLSPSVGCGEYIPQDGDVIEFHYTLDLGNDINISRE